MTSPTSTSSPSTPQKTTLFTPTPNWPAPPPFLLSKAPSNNGIQVVDLRPAMAFRLWVRDDAYFATARIKEIFLENKFQDYDNRVLEIRDCFRNIRLVAQPNAIEEFELHLQDKTIPQ